MNGHFPDSLEKLKTDCVFTDLSGHLKLDYESFSSSGVSRCLEVLLVIPFGV